MLDDIASYFYDNHFEKKVLIDIAQHLDNVLAGNDSLKNTPYLIGTFLKLTKLDKCDKINIGTGTFLDSINVESGYISKFVNGFNLIRDIWKDASTIYDNATKLYGKTADSMEQRTQLVELFDFFRLTVMDFIL